MEAKEQEIILYLIKFGYIYIKIENEVDINLIYNAIVNNIFEENVSAIVNNYYGVYCMVRKNINSAIKYYSKAANEKYLPAVKNLILYYGERNDINKTIEYQRILANLGDRETIGTLLEYYQKEERHEDLMHYFVKALQFGHRVISNRFVSNIRHNKSMLNYLLVAADFDHIGALSILIGRSFVDDFDKRIKYCSKLIVLDKRWGKTYLIEVFNDCIKRRQHDNVVYCYQMLTELDVERAKQLLSYYYYTIDDYNNMIKAVDVDYILNNTLIKDEDDILLTLFNIHPEIFNDELYVKRILLILDKLITKKDFDDRLINIIEHIEIKYFVNAPKFLYMYKKLLNEKINLLDLHFNYSPDNKGYQEAKKDFIERLV